MRRSCTQFLSIFTFMVLIAASTAQVFSQDTGAATTETLPNSFPAKQPYSPYADRAFPTRALLAMEEKHERVG
jgi:hypothetical protein